MFDSFSTGINNTKPLAIKDISMLEELGDMMFLSYTESFNLHGDDYKEADEAFLATLGLTRDIRNALSHYLTHLSTAINRILIYDKIIQ